MNLKLMAVLIVLFTSITVHAQTEDDERPRRGKNGPPEVALEACSNLVQGDPCSFEGRRGNAVDGTCETREDKPLACRPEGHRQREQTLQE